MKSLLTGAAALALLSPIPAMAQDHSGHAMPAPTPAPTPAPVDHATMDHSTMDHAAMSDGADEHEAMEMGMAGQGSGTSRLPMADYMNHGLHVPVGQGSLMVHGYAWGVYTDQSGPRGDDKLYAQSMAMLTYQRPFDGGQVTARAMLSAEPAMRHDGYPNLFATGEAAYGAPLVDRQHPHDLVMELAARLDLDIADGARAFVYGGPVGEPALGPSAFMHRHSARYNPEAPITHHWFDSTHITYGVATAGLALTRLQFEASAFRGREPDEHRWNIEKPKLDSWSARASFAPSPNWLIQASYGELDEPEELHPGEDEHRTTASAHYDSGTGLSAMAGFSAKNRVPGDTLTAWLAEINWDLTRHHTLFGRFENVANDELFPDHLDPLHDRKFRVSKFQAGYAYRLPLGRFGLALGGTVSAFAKPQALDAAYGRHPMGYTLFARLSLGD
ncbi:MAG TPA: hypothetical protein VM055_06905 [Novosphingobium sp.]|nr:hypothetical protein [Novosphingobium sp.]